MTEYLETISTKTRIDEIPEEKCFLCSERSKCDVAVLDGMLEKAFVQTIKGQKWVAVILRMADGAKAVVKLTERHRVLVEHLGTLGTQNIPALHVRCFHIKLGSWKTGQDNSDNRIYLFCEDSIIVLEPDILLNITDIKHADYCTRQYLLRRLAPSPHSSASIRGNVIHSAFRSFLQEFRSQRSEDNYAPLKKALSDNMLDMVYTGMAYEQILQESKPHYDHLTAWFAHQTSKLWGSVPDIRAETFLMEPKIGLKGRLDFYWHDGEEQRLLELKTGKANTMLPKREDLWQVRGYQALLMAHGKSLMSQAQATLIYSDSQPIASHHGVPFTTRNLHNIVDMRNSLVIIHVSGHISGPPSVNKCQKCALYENCSLSSALLGWEAPFTRDSDDQTDIDLGSMITRLTEPERAFWANFYNLLWVERRTQDKQQSELWNTDVIERVRQGICIPNLQMQMQPQKQAVNEWIYHFSCENISEMRAGDEILLSDGDPVYGEVITGRIIQIDTSYIKISAPEFLQSPRQVDRYSSDSGHDRLLKNMFRWLSLPSRKRKLLAGLIPPASAGKDDIICDGLNEFQREAVRKALNVQDYMLIQGPPGTGKTKVIAEVVQRYVKNGKRVLLAGFTNQSVDNMLEALIDRQFTDFIRLGHASNVGSRLHPFLLSSRIQSGKENPDAEEIAETIKSAPVIAATASAWSSDTYHTSPMFSFDVAIIDEAGQLTVPAALGSLCLADTYILVGDEKQLPPLVQDEEASKNGLSVSIFEHFLKASPPESVQSLNIQYRMNETISTLDSMLFYDGELRTYEENKNRTYPLPLVSSESNYYDILRNESPIIFVDMKKPLFEENQKTSHVQADLISQLVNEMYKNQVPLKDIGIIAPFRAQVALIRSEIQSLIGTESFSQGIVVDTVDRFQGAEREIILLSLISGADILNKFTGDRNRLNVAISRAKSKLIILGSSADIADTPILPELVKYCTEVYSEKPGIISYDGN